MTNTNDVMGVINPTTNTHNNIDDLSFFDFAVEKDHCFLKVHLVQKDLIRLM